MKLWSMLVVSALVGCGKGDSKAPAASKVTTGSGAGSAITAGSATGSGVEAGSAAVTAAPIDPKVTAARCNDPCLFLTDTPLDKLVETVKAACPAPESAEVAKIEADACEQMDYFRNCIFAAHGFAFEKKKWKNVFKEKPWYTIKPEFKASMVTPAERATVTALNDQAKACKKANNVSAPQMKIIEEWFAALPKAPPPPMGMVDYEKAKGKDVVEAIVGELSPEKKKLKGYKLGKDAMVRYAKPTDEDPPPFKPEEVGAAKDAKIRTVVVDIDAGTVGDEENPILEGTHIRFAFDDKDTLLAISVAHYLYD
jgi:hypothetical protein